MEIHTSRRADLNTLPYALHTKWTMETEIDKMDKIDDNQPSTCGKADENFLPHLAAEQPFHAFSILGPGEAFSIMTKTCSKCGEDKPLDQFHKLQTGKHGVRGACKTCCKKARKAYYAANRKKALADAKKHHENNKEKKAEYDKAYREANKKKIAARFKVYYKANKEKRLAYNEAYRKKRLLKDAEFRMIHNLRGRLNKAINRGDKSDITMALIGCTSEQLRQHIESQFTTGMSWDNYGFYGWHIDHIKPCASFDMSDPEQQRECFHYTNLQPLWAEDNLAKSDKTI